MMPRKFLSIFVLLQCLMLLGCGSVAPAPSRQEGAAALQSGLDAFAQKNYAAAAESLTNAIGSGVLNTDQYVDATLKRAMAWAAEGKFDEALADLTKLEGGAPNLDQVYAARAFVLKKQGKVAEANAAMAKARQHNRMIKEFM
jgi:Tfp pilus assembly protein PilF